MTNEQLDILIGRVVDHEARAEDWAALESLAKSDPSVWSRLTQATKDDALLRAGFEEAVRGVDAVELPAEALRGASLQPRRLGAWSGWAAAAMIALAWAGVSGALPGSPFGGNAAGLMTADQAWDQYREVGEREGRVLGELDQRLLQSRPLGDGLHIEVFYVRQILERALVDDVYTNVRDELGNSVPVPVTNVSNTLSGRLY